MKKLFLLVLVIFFQSTLYSQILERNIVLNNPNIDYKHLELIHETIKPYIENQWEAGIVTLVVKDNQIVHYEGHGYSDRDSKTPMKPDAIFRIMSQTKAITSLAAMQLLEQGKFQLDQNISDFIPEFKNPKVVASFNPTDTTYTTIPAKREITFRDLLTHSSGIDYAGIGSPTMRAIYQKANVPSGLGIFKFTLLDKIKELGKLPLIHQPGEKFTYGLNTDVLGCLVEVISGETLEEYFHRHIFEPLGMKDSYFNLPEEKGSRLPTVYTENEKGEMIVWSPTFRGIDPAYPLLKKSFFSGGAGMVATAHDYAIFLQMLLNEGKYNGKQIISRKTAQLMLSPQTEPGELRENPFALGFEITSPKSSNRGMRSEGSFAWGGYYGTTYWADPKENLIVLLMSQHTPKSHYDLFGKLENIIYSSLK